MLVFCGRRHGLYANLTRFVYFREPTAEEETLIEHVARVEAVTFAVSRPGTTLGAVYDVIVARLRRAGAPGRRGAPPSGRDHRLPLARGVRACRAWICRSRRIRRWPGTRACRAPRSRTRWSRPRRHRDPDARSGLAERRGGRPGAAGRAGAHVARARGAASGRCGSSGTILPSQTRSSERAVPGQPQFDLARRADVRSSASRWVATRPRGRVYVHLPESYGLALARLAGARS